MKKITCLAILLMLTASVAFAQSVERVEMMYVDNLTKKEFTELWLDRIPELQADIEDDSIWTRETTMVPNPARDDMLDALALYTVKAGDTFFYATGWGEDTAFAIFVRVKSATKGQAKETTWFALEIRE